jgi:hypothetical protein
MKCLSLFILLLISCIVAVAQTTEQTDIAQGIIATGITGGVSTTFGQVFNRPLNESYNRTRKTYSDFEGTAFQFEKPIRAKLILTDGSFVKEALLQFDLYSDEIIVSTEDSGDQLMNKSLVKTIICVDNEEVKTFSRPNIETPLTFYEQIYLDDYISLIKKEYVTVRQGENYGLSKVSAKFIHRNNYYMQVVGGYYEQVRLNKNDILEKLSQKDAEAIQQYAKDNKNKLKEEVDFVKAFDSIVR